MLAMITGLTDAGWTQQDTPAQVIGTFSGQPSNNDTITLDSSPNQKVYRFRTSIAQINDVLIDVDAATSFANLVLAITAGAGAGTKYFTGTTANVNMTATSAATTITVAYRTAGSAGNGAPVAESTANFTWASGSLSQGYTWLRCVKTPQGLQCGIKLFTTAGGFYTPGTTIQIFMTSFDLTRVSTVNMGSGSNVPASTNYRIVANKYQFFIYIVGSTDVGGSGSFVAGGVPFIQSPLVAPTISAATNATPIVCTIAAHGFTTGQDVFNSGATGNTAVNGTFTITVLSANTFELDGSVGNGAYTANSAFCANTTIGSTLAEVIWGTSGATGSPITFRNNIISEYYFLGLNGVRHNAATDNNPYLQFIKPSSIGGGINSSVQWFNNNYLMFEPILFGGPTNGSIPKIIGQLWDSVEIIFPLPLEQTAVFDSPPHNFIALCIDGARGWSLMVATS